MRWRTIIVTTSICAGLAGYLMLMRDADEGLTDIPAPEQPGYYLKQATVTQTGVNGLLRTRLKAEQIMQNVADDSISMQQVVVDHLDEDANDWLLTADSGHLPPGSANVEFNQKYAQGDIKPGTAILTLTGNVLIRARDVSKTNVEIHTDVLNVDTVSYVATAPGKVRFVQGRNELTGVGMKFDFKGQKLRLESQINGHYQ
ncbi:MAG: LPS export ABC transporter periplasmic protein LptC [Steroidobacteraceae bacterium]